MRLLFVAVVLVLVSRTAAAQTPEKPLSFEVASVKPAPAPIQTKDEYSAGYNAGMRSALASFGIRITGQRVNITDNTLKDLVRLAYEVKDYQISASAAWMDSDKYEIVANMPAGTNRDQAPAMLRTLLESRFHLQLRRETKKTSVYAVVAARGGPRLSAAAGPPNSRPNGNTWNESGVGHLRARNFTMSAFAGLITKLSDRPVIDGTGLPDLYDFDFTYSADLNTTAPEPAPSLAAALQALGLRLEKRDVPLEYLVIEHADRVPVEN